MYNLCLYKAKERAIFDIQIFLSTIYTNERLTTIYTNGLPAKLYKSEEEPTNYTITSFCVYV